MAGESRLKFKPPQRKGKGGGKTPGMVKPGATNLRTKKFGKHTPKRVIREPSKKPRVDMKALLEHLDPTNKKGGGRSL